jgi:hypothetical protein
VRDAIALALGGGRSDAGVWADNVAIVEAFLGVTTQWRAMPLGGGFVAARIVYLGLDYAAATAGLAAAGITVTPELWAGVRIMEAAACARLNELNR